MQQKSTLTGGAATPVKTVTFEHLATLYKESFDFPLESFLPANGVQLYRCEDTGYEFFAPNSAMGSPAFYEALYDGADWAYQDTKWEYAVASEFMRPNDRVLDVGSGAGQFLAGLTAAERVGLETNRKGREATPAGIVALDETVETHAESRSEHYDVVTAIQVLEHVYDVRSFLDACLALLRPGGILVLSVPNNDGFVGIQELPLNMPPHHMGRWTRRSLSTLAPLLGLEMMRVEVEPLQEANLGWYQSWMEREYLPKSRFKRSLYYRLGFAKGLRQWLEENRTTIKGHTILAAYRKPATLSA